MKFLRAHRGGIRMTHASPDTNTEDIPLAIKQLITKPLWLTTRYDLPVVVIHNIRYLVTCQIPYAISEDDDRSRLRHNLLCSDLGLSGQSLFAGTRPGAMRGPLCLLL